MPVAFAIDPVASIFRSVINGDDALSPSTPANVYFDAFGPRVHGMTQRDVVPFSSFSGPLYYEIATPTPHLSNPYFMYTFTFPEPLDYCPVAVILFQKQDGSWTRNYSATGGSVTVTGGFVSTQTELLIYTTANGPSVSSTLQPLAASYRLFGG
jgi:hypothetical protein